MKRRKWFYVYEECNKKLVKTYEILGNPGPLVFVGKIKRTPVFMYD